MSVYGYVPLDVPGVLGVVPLLVDVLIVQYDDMGDEVHYLAAPQHVYVLSTVVAPVTIPSVHIMQNDKSCKYRCLLVKLGQYPDNVPLNFLVLTSYVLIL